MALKENSLKVFNYIKDNNGKDITSADIAVAVGLEKKSVDGCVTGLQKKKLVERVSAEMELADGTHKPIKLIRMTEAGFAFDPYKIEEN